MTRTYLGLITLVPVAAFLAVARGPIASGGPVRLSAREIASRKAARDARDAAITKMDDLFLRGRTQEALTGYADLNAKGRRPSVDLLLKIGACRMVQGDYPGALAEYRRAEDLGERTGNPSAMTGRIQAQTAYLAHLAGDAATLDSVVDAAARSMVATPTHLAREAPMDGPAKTANREAQVYVFFGRNLSVVFQRSGTDFAYRKALEVGGPNASISYEYSCILTSAFFDTPAALRVLRAVDRSTAGKMAGTIRTEIDNYADGLRALESAPSSAVAREAARMKAETEKAAEDSFRGSGTYDFGGSGSVRLARKI